MALILIISNFWISVFQKVGCNPLLGLDHNFGTPKPKLYLYHQIDYLLEASCSPCPPRSPRRASASSRKRIAGALNRANSKMKRTIFSESPRHLLAKLLACKLKKVAPLVRAKARANMVFPVPGGPHRRIPRVR